MLTRIAQILLVVSLVPSSACVHARTNPERVIRIAKKGLVGIDVALEQLQPLVDEATELRIAKCESTEPGPERDACLGPFAAELAPKVQRLAALYDGTVTTLDELLALWRELQPLLDAARAEVRR